MDTFKCNFKNEEFKNVKFTFRTDLTFVIDVFAN